MTYRTLLTNTDVSPKQLKDEGMFGILHNLYFQKLFNIAYGYTSSKEDAEEIVQDVFVKLWKRQEQIASISNITGYLYMMTRNSCLDFLRSKKDKLAIGTNTVQQQNLLDFYAFSNNTASSIIEKELQEQIEEGIKQLPEKCRLVFIKSRLEGLKHKEIALNLDISTKTVENHITKALKHLKVYLKEYFN